MKITVDARECGAGKTHGVKGTFNRIKLLLDEQKLVLVVVPSINLSTDYQKEFSNCSVINSTSDHDESVSGRLITAMANRYPLIIITSQALLQAEILQSVRSGYNVIIDEAFDPFRSITINKELRDELLHWQDYIERTDSNLDRADYVHVTFKDLLTNDITKDSKKIRDLLHPNFTTDLLVEYTELLPDDTRKLKYSINDNTKLSFNQLLKPDFFDGFESIHIAAAHFDYTQLSWWFKYHGLSYKVIFQPKKHDRRVILHIPDFSKTHNKKSKFHWTKYKRDNTMADFIPQYHSYVSSTVGNSEILILRNKSANNENEQVSYVGKRLKHNSAGDNSSRHIRNISLESTLNLSPEYNTWLTQFVPSNAGDDAIFNSITGYTYYQSLMRSYLRNENWMDGDYVNVFLIDERAFLFICDVIRVDVDDYVEYDINYTLDDEPALSANERKLLSRYNKKQDVPVDTKPLSNKEKREYLHQMKQK